VAFLRYQQQWPATERSALGYPRPAAQYAGCRNHPNVSCIGGVIVSHKKIAVVALLCAVVALAACRRETAYEPLKLGGPTAEQPAR
jgi:hypothetical protein